MTAGVRTDLDAHVTQIAALGIQELLATGVLGTIEHDARSNLIHTKIVTTAELNLVESAGIGASKGGGVKLFQVPQSSLIQPFWASVRGRLHLSAATATSTAGEIGLGATLATGAVATLSTAGWEDILEGGVPALASITAGGSIAFSVRDGLRTAFVGNGATPTAVHLNAASAFGVAVTNLVLEAGAVIEICWQAIPI